MPAPSSLMISYAGRGASDGLGDPARLGAAALLLLILGLTILFVSVLVWMWDRTRRRAGDDPVPDDPIFTPQPDFGSPYRRRVPVRDAAPAGSGGLNRVGMLPEDWGLLAQVPGAVVVLFHGRIRCATREFARRVGAHPDALAGRVFKEFLGTANLLDVVDRLEALDRGEIERCQLQADLVGDPIGPPVSLHAVRVRYGAEHLVLVSLAPILIAAVGTGEGLAAVAAPAADRSDPAPVGPPVAESSPEPRGENSDPVADLLANVSHELQTPLVTVRGYTEMILKGRLGPITSEQEKGLRVSLRNIDRLIERIDELLEVNRDRHQADFRMEEFPVWEAVEAAVETVQQKENGRGIPITTSYGTDRLVVRADRERIRQVLTNLLHNGVKFNRPGGSVHVAVTDAGEQFIEVEVRDTGIGIPRQALDQVFNRFFRVGGGAAGGREGSGLGLAIAKSIVERHGGTIRVSSEPSVGSSFRFTLPRGAASPRN